MGSIALRSRCPVVDCPAKTGKTRTRELKVRGEPGAFIVASRSTVCDSRVPGCPHSQERSQDQFWERRDQAFLKTEPQTECSFFSKWNVVTGKEHFAKPVMDLEIHQRFASNFAILKLTENEVRDSTLGAHFDCFGNERIIRVFWAMGDPGDELHGPGVALRANELCESNQFTIAKRAEKSASFQVPRHFSLYSQEILSVMPKGFSLTNRPFVKDLHDSLYEVVVELHRPHFDTHFGGFSQGSPCLLGYVVAMPLFEARDADSCHGVPLHDMVEFRLSGRGTVQKSEDIHPDSRFLYLLQELMRNIHILVEFLFEPANLQNATAYNDRAASDCVQPHCCLARPRDPWLRKTARAIQR